MDFDAEVSRVSREADRAADEAAERFARVGSLDGVATAPDGTVTVTVSPGGTLNEVKVAPQALRAGPHAVARQIMELADRATRRAGDKMYRALAPVLGRDGDEQLSSLGYEQLPEDELEDVIYHGPGVR